MSDNPSGMRTVGELRDFISKLPDETLIDNLIHSTLYFRTVEKRDVARFNLNKDYYTPDWNPVTVEQEEI